MSKNVIKVEFRDPMRSAPPEPETRASDLTTAWRRIEALEAIVMTLTREAHAHFERANAIDAALVEERACHQASQAELERLRRELAHLRGLEPIT